MSASTEKKIRAKAREEGTDKKTIKAQEEAAKKAKTHKKYVVAIIAAVVFIALILLVNSTFLYRHTSAIKIGNDSYTPAEFNYEYSCQYYNFLNYYGSYASYFGLDTSSGINGLGTQECTMSENGGTWRDYFKEMTIPTLKQLTALCNYANENGITLSEDEIATVDAMFDGVEDLAKGYGYKNADAYFSVVYGKGVNSEVIRSMELRNALANKVYDMFVEEANAADEDFVDYDMVSVRHILIMVEADENGEYTDEAKAAAKAKAEEILAEYESGDKTEESFAQLAETYSDDTGSNTNGGLYENVYRGEMVTEFNDWCFDSSRKAGDTGIVYNEGSYVGYHVMYYSGIGDKYSTSSARESELSSVVEERLTALEDSYEVVTPFFYTLVGKN